MEIDDEHDLLECAFQTVPGNNTPTLQVAGRGARGEAKTIVDRLTLAFFAVGVHMETCNPDYKIKARWTAKSRPVAGSGGRYEVWVKVGGKL